MSSIQKQAVMNSDQEEDEKAERRIGVDRRQFSYSAYIPERRSGIPRSVLKYRSMNGSMLCAPSLCRKPLPWGRFSAGLQGTEPCTLVVAIALPLAESFGKAAAA